MADELDDFLNGGAADTSAADQVADETLAPGEEQIGDDAAAATDEGQGDPPAQPKRSAQDRIDELTRARREAEREAAHWKRLAQEGKQPEPQPKPQAAEDAEPDPTKYQYGETDAGYIRDLARFEARREFKAEAERHQQRTQAQTVEQTWTERQADFAKDNPDYREVIDRDWVCTPVMADAIKTSEEGARVAYHLAQHPDEARRIAGLNPLAQVRELGRLEAKLATPAAPPTPQPKTVSDAPPPHPQARGLSGRFAPAPDTDDLDAFEKSFFADR